MKLFKPAILFLPVTALLIIGACSRLKENNAPPFSNAILSEKDFTIKKRELSAKTMDAFKKEVQRSNFLVKNFFVNNPSPYAAPISDEVRCPKKFHPIEFIAEDPHSMKSALQLYAGRRYESGICSDDSAVYTSLLILLYCKDSQQAHEIKIYRDVHLPAVDFKKIFNAFICNPNGANAAKGE